MRTRQIITLAVGFLGLGLRVRAGEYSDAILADQPLAYYRLDEATGTIARDATGHALPGARYNGGVKLGTAGPQRAVFPGLEATNEGATFDEVATYLDTGSSITMLGAGSYSFELWFNEAFDGSLHYLGGRYAGDGSYLGDSLLLSGALIYFDGSNSFGLVPCAPDLWHQVVLTRSDAVVSVYLDGKLAITATAPAQYGKSSQFIVGARGDLAANTFLKGGLDELSIYDRALTAAQVAAHFAAASNPKGSKPEQKDSP